MAEIPWRFLPSPRANSPSSQFAIGIWSNPLEPSTILPLSFSTPGVLPLFPTFISTDRILPARVTCRQVYLASLSPADETRQSFGQALYLVCAHDTFTRHRHRNNNILLLTFCLMRLESGSFFAKYNFHRDNVSHLFIIFAQDLNNATIHFAKVQISNFCLAIKVKKRSKKSCLKIEKF